MCTSLFFHYFQFIVMANKYQIPNFREASKLDGTYYPLWKMKIKSHLVLRESWEIVTGRELMPQPTVVLATLSAAAVTTPTDPMAMKAWQNCDVEALPIIVSTTADDVYLTYRWQRLPSRLGPF